MRALPGQWRDRFGYTPLLAESFTDPEAYAGFGPSSGLGSLVSSLAQTLAEAGWEATVVLAAEQPVDTLVLAVLGGFSLEMVPEPLFWYRRSADDMLGGSQSRRRNASSATP
ncbi:MAG: hypothetical protein PHP75_03765 [Methylacidiphilaceae bacterium]|nr:hypothetical protein [Candidatus Methylacidiphilaceae bacterium]